MSKKLFIGNLSFQLSDLELEDLFKEYGEVASAKVIVDRMTGRSRGFGFVEMNSEDSAQKAMDALNGTEIKGRPINVSFAKEQQEGDRRGFSQRGSGSGGGGFRKRNNYNNY